GLRAFRRRESDPDELLSLPWDWANKKAAIPDRYGWEPPLNWTTNFSKTYLKHHSVICQDKISEQHRTLRCLLTARIRLGTTEVELQALRHQSQKACAFSLAHKRYSTDQK